MASSSQAWPIPSIYAFGVRCATVSLVTERSLLWIVKLDGVSGADLKKSQPPPGAKKKSYVPCLAAKPPLCALYHKAFSSKICFPNSSGSSADKREMQGQSCWAEFGESETLLPTGVSRPPLLRHTSSTEKWIHSALHDFSKAVVWMVIYGGLICRGITSRSRAACGEPGFLCVPAPVGDFYLPLKS